MDIWKSLLKIFFFLVLAALGLAALLARNPIYNPDFFTPEYQEVFSTPEIAFEKLWDAHVSGDKEAYAEVLGRDLDGVELELRASPDFERPRIDRVKLSEGSAYITGMSWKGSFEKIGGRWVFQNKEIGMYCRSLFRLVGVELVRFTPPAADASQK